MSTRFRLCFHYLIEYRPFCLVCILHGLSCASLPQVSAMPMTSNPVVPVAKSPHFHWTLQPHFSFLFAYSVQGSFSGDLVESSFPGDTLFYIECERTTVSYRFLVALWWDRRTSLHISAKFKSSQSTWFPIRTTPDNSRLKDSRGWPCLGHCIAWIAVICLQRTCRCFEAYCLA